MCNFKKGDTVKHHGEREVLECTIIDKVQQTSYTTDRGRIEREFDYHVYTLKVNATGAIITTVECGRFELVEIGLCKDDICNREGCTGTIAEHQSDRGCTCYVNPPCSHCTDVHERLYCPVCDWQGSDD